MLYQKSNSIGQYFYQCIRYSDFHFVPHMHKHLELIHVAEGSVILELDGREEEIDAGEYALILSNQIHAYRSPCHSTAYICIFSADYVPMFAKEVQGKRPEHALFTCRPAVSAFLESELFLPGCTPNQYAIKSALYAVLGEYLSQVTMCPESTGDEELIYKILRYVGGHYTEDLTLANVAGVLGYERHYLSRYFHSRISMNFSKFVNWYRTDAATDLLEHTDLPMTAVAMQSGFQSIRSFNRVYAELTGHSPKQAAKGRA